MQPVKRGRGVPPEETPGSLEKLPIQLELGNKSANRLYSEFTVNP